MAFKSKYSALKRLDIDALYSKFLGMSPREQMMALGGAIFLLFVIIFLPVSLASGKISRMEKLLEKSHEQMGDIVHEIDAYNRVKARLDALERNLTKGSDVPLGSTIEGIADAAGVKSNMQSQNEKERPGATYLFDESIVELKLSRVTLDQLVNLLYKFETDRGRLLRVTKLDIKPRHDNRKLFDTAIEVSSYKLAGEETGEE